MTIKKITGELWGLFTLLLLVLSTCINFVPILILGLGKLFPNLKWRIACTKLIEHVIHFWCSINHAFINRTQKINWRIQGMDKVSLSSKDWYLIVANHQSWLDIVLLQRLFHGKIPLLKFFVKDQLKWLPLLGFAWWAMGSPFMKRYSKEYLAKHPEKKGKDLQATRKALTLFKKTPSALINFIEGTRFTPEKKAAQKSDYQHLLRPKAGGISFVISAMNEKLHNILDVTIVYPNKHSLWDFLCRRMKNISVDVRYLPIPKKFINAALMNNHSLQEEFRLWLNEYWAKKDALIKHLRSQHVVSKQNSLDTMLQNDECLPQNEF